jgi:hypothetical protein
MNKIEIMAKSGHEEAAQFMKSLETLLVGQPWNDPPSAPGAIAVAVQPPDGTDLQSAACVA